MNVTAALRNAHQAGTRAGPDLPPLPHPWTRRRARLRRRVLLVVGLVVGVFVVATLVWGLIDRDGR